MAYSVERRGEERQRGAGAFWRETIDDPRFLLLAGLTLLVPAAALLYTAFVREPTGFRVALAQTGSTIAQLMVAAEDGRNATRGLGGLPLPELYVCSFRVHQTKLFEQT